MTVIDPTGSGSDPKIGQTARPIQAPPSGNTGVPAPSSPNIGDDTRAPPPSKFEGLDPNLTALADAVWSNVPSYAVMAMIAADPVYGSIFAAHWMAQQSAAQTTMELIAQGIVDNAKENSRAIRELRRDDREIA